MEKKVIRMTESDLHRIVKESVNRVINEDLEGLPLIYRKGRKLIDDLKFVANNWSKLLDKMKENPDYMGDKGGTMVQSQIINSIEEADNLIKQLKDYVKVAWGQNYSWPGDRRDIWDWENSDARGLDFDVRQNAGIR